jgi:thymidylate synthase
MSNNKREQKYLDLLSSVLRKGHERHTRNGKTFSLFGKSLKFDMREGLPVLTTKKMFTRGVIEELLFFLRGDTDTSQLSAKNVKIWEGNTSRNFLDKIGLNYSEGVMGPMYGHNYRSFGASYILDINKKPVKCIGLDQLALVVNTIKTDPHSRRILMTSFNPSQVDQCVLYPCHSLILQFYVDDGYIDCYCYNRSQDLFLGTPFNIMSSALMLHIISNLCNLQPRFLKMGLGDCHIYEQHISAVHTQLQRKPLLFPTLEMTNIETLDDLNRLSPADFIFKNYVSYDSLTAPMIP